MAAQIALISILLDVVKSMITTMPGMIYHELRLIRYSVSAYRGNGVGYSFLGYIGVR